MRATATRGPDSPVRRLAERVTRLFPGSRHDAVIALIPLGVLLSLSMHVIAGLAVRPALFIGSVFAALVLVDALFFHPPRGAGPPSQAS